MEVPTRHIRTEADKLAIQQGYQWNSTYSDNITTWIESNIVLSSTGELIKLTSEQKTFLEALYNWRTPTGKRRWKKCLLTTGKKSFGKSLLAAILALYHCLEENVHSPNVVIGAATKDQSGELFREIHFAIRHNELFQKLTECVPSQKTIRIPECNGLIRAISQESLGKGGWNCSLVIEEECALHRDDALHTMLKGACVARTEPLHLFLSNAGHDKTHWYFTDVYSVAKDIESGKSLDLEFLSYIYEVPEEADWQLESNWPLANPCLNYGSLATLDSLRSQYKDAKLNKANEMFFRRFFCNQFTSKKNAWVDISEWDACKGPLPSDDQLRNAPLFIAVDLSKVNDLTSICACWCLDKYYLRSFNFATRHSLERREHANLRDYRHFEYAGHLKIIDGNAIEYDQVVRCIKSIPGRLQLLIFDRWSSLAITQQLEKEPTYKGKVMTFPQEHKYYNEAVKRFEILIKDKAIQEEGNTCLRWCLNNTQLDVNKAGLVMPTKGSSTAHNDAACCAIMAISQALLPNNQPAQEYKRMRFV